MKNIFLTTIGLLALSACVSNNTVQTVEVEDFDLNCGQLRDQLTELGVKFEEAGEDSGVTAKNVAFGIFFWPGIVANEWQAGKNENSINKRIEHLTNLYVGKCVNQKSESNN